MERVSGKTTVIRTRSVRTIKFFQKLMGNEEAFAFDFKPADAAMFQVVNLALRVWALPPDQRTAMEAAQSELEDGQNVRLMYHIQPMRLLDGETLP